MVTASRLQSEREWLAALAAAAATAQAAVLLLRPRHGMMSARPVEALEHFEAGDIARARRFARGQLALGALGGAGETALLVWLSRREGKRAAGGGERDGLGTIAVRGAGLSAALVLAPLPFGALMRVRALRAGLATQSWRGWAGDVVRGGALGAAFTASASVVVAALARRDGEDWWKAAAGGSVAVAAAVTLVGPVVLDPIFNDFTPLRDGDLRREVLALSERAGVTVREVFEVDASRRTRAVNAYVNGLGASRRVVLFDTLLESFTPAEARSVVAHELAHVRYRDVPRMLVYLGLVAPAGARAVARLSARLAGAAKPEGNLPALALAAGVVSGTIGVITRQLSRAMERRADAFALELTGDPDAFISFERRITGQNLADPDPPRWLRLALGTHPPIVERIGIATAYAAGERPTPPRRPRSPRTRAGS